MGRSGILSSPVVIVGLHSSGKSTLARAVGHYFNARVFELGDGVRQAAQHKGSENLVEVAHDLLAIDELYLARSAIERAGTSQQHSIFVGPRTIAEFEFIMDTLNDPLTVGLRAEREYRYKRWQHRHLKYNDTWDQREWHEALWKTDELIPVCKIPIDATNDLKAKCFIVCAELESTAPV